MNSFFADLKQAREARGITLAEISDATLISIKMLEAMESGNHKIVPQAYLRAFIREYATVIGQDKDDVMRRYDEWLREQSEPAGKPQAQPVVAPSQSELPAQEGKESGTARFQRLMPTFFKIGVAIVVLVLVDIVLWSVLDKESTPQVRENSFRDVIRDQEARLGITDSASNKIVNARSTSPVRYSASDSLVLVATTTDTVWMEIVVDDEILTEHLLPPKSSFTWKAKNEFWISAIGNPTAIKFTLNGNPVAHPVKKGFVTRDYRLTRDSLKTP